MLHISCYKKLYKNARRIEDIIDTYENSVPEMYKDIPIEKIYKYT